MQNDIELQALMFAQIVQKQASANAIVQKHLSSSNTVLESQFHHLTVGAKSNEEPTLSSNTEESVNPHVKSFEQSLLNQSNIMKQLMQIKMGETN